MFTKVRLQNFRSFKDITFDLSDTKNKYKNFAMVYGENGVGKSNLISGFEAAYSFDANDGHTRCVG